MAKRTSRKQSATRKAAPRVRARKGGTRRGKRPASAKRAPARAAKQTRQQAARRATTRVSRKKTAARAAATRTTRSQAKPPEPGKLATAATAVKGAVASAVASVARRMPGAPAQMDAITLLETDHRRLEDLFKRGEETTARAVKERRDLLATITAELNVHELIEERLLYPALKQYPEARDIVLEGFQEHHVADLIVKELHDVATDDEQWAPKFKVLKENIEHHIEEEEGPMFRTARGVMSQEELQSLGARMARLKTSAKKGPLPKS